MISIVFILIILVALLILIALAWRIASRLYTLPCPVWMKGLLDPPSFGGVSARTQKTIGLLDSARDERAGRGLRPGAAHYPDRSARWARGRSDGNGSAGGDAAGGGGTGPCCKPHQHPVPPGGIGEGKLERGRFDRAVLVTVPGEIPGREAALREIFGALRPGGILLVEETIRDPHFQTRSTVTRLGRSAGFIGKEFSGNRFSYIFTWEKPPGT